MRVVRPPTDPADELYTASPSDFIRLRDALVRKLRSAGQDSIAAAVQPLRKPTLAIWALNQAARNGPANVRGTERDDMMRRRGAELERESKEREREAIGSEREAHHARERLRELEGGRRARGRKQARRRGSRRRVCATPQNRERR